jgi:hypothetical protein
MYGVAGHKQFFIVLKQPVGGHVALRDAAAIDGARMFFRLDLRLLLSAVQLGGAAGECSPLSKIGDCQT